MYCQSARSSSVSANFVELASSAFKSYEHSGGKKASFEAILPGQGGQQNRQHNSLRLNPFMMYGDKDVFVFNLIDGGRFGGKMKTLQFFLSNVG